MKQTTNGRTILERARELAPLVREHAERGEQERRLPAPVVEAFRDAGIFRLCRPSAFGGLEADPLTTIDVVEELSHADGAAGWCAMISGAGAFFEAFVSKRGGAEMFADPRAVSGGVIAPTGRALEVEGGYRVTGRWSMASGCQHCDWIGGNCVVFDGAVPRPGPGPMPECVVAFLPSSELKIVDTWHVSGLRGTGSHDVEVADAFVPSQRCIRMPPAPSPHEGPLFAFPFFGFLAAAVASTALGIARAALDEIESLAKSKTPFGGMSKLSARPTAQQAVCEAHGLLRSGGALLRETAGQVWGEVKTGRPVSAEERALLRIAATHAVSSAARAVDLAYTAGGATSIYSKNPLQRCFRDVHTVTQHYLVAPQTNEQSGKVLLGAVPDDPML
jgi:alkylation response protein AidB-like acyl-CoA dehydrogenase